MTYPNMVNVQCLSCLSTRLVEAVTINGTEMVRLPDGWLMEYMTGKDPRVCCKICAVVIPATARLKAERAAQGS